MIAKFYDIRLVASRRDRRQPRRPSRATTYFIASHPWSTTGSPDQSNRETVPYKTATCRDIWRSVGIFSVYAVHFTLGTPMRDQDAVPELKPKCLPCPIALVIGVLLMILAYGWVSTVVQKVFSGAGLDHCCTIEGARFNYISVFVLLCGMVLALLVAATLQLRDWRMRRDFERRYRVRVPPDRSRSTNSSDSTSSGSFHGAEYGDGD